VTKVNPLSPTIRETASLYKGRPIIVELHSSFLLFRVKGLRKLVAQLTVEGALERALYNAASLELAAKSPRKRIRKNIKAVR